LRQVSQQQVQGGRGGPVECFGEVAHGIHLNPRFS
jgi:hypothetical protein